MWNILNIPRELVLSMKIAKVYKQIKTKIQETNWTNYMKYVNIHSLQMGNCRTKKRNKLYINLQKKRNSTYRLNIFQQA